MEELKTINKIYRRELEAMERRKQSIVKSLRSQPIVDENYIANFISKIDGRKFATISKRFADKIALLNDRTIKSH